MLLITLWSASIPLSLPSALCQHVCLPFRVFLSLFSSTPVLSPHWLTENTLLILYNSLSKHYKAKWKSFSSPPLFRRLSQVLTIINFPMLSTPTEYTVYHRNYYTYCCRSFIIFFLYSYLYNSFRAPSLQGTSTSLRYTNVSCHYFHHCTSKYSADTSVLRIYSVFKGSMFIYWWQSQYSIIGFGFPNQLNEASTYNQL